MIIWVDKRIKIQQAGVTAAVICRCLFELASGGTVLLDEIGDLPMSAQVKLLRVIEQGEFTAVGDVRPRKCDVRIVAATNRDLQRAVDQGTFREDLLYRLAHSLVVRPIAPIRRSLDDKKDDGGYAGGDHTFD